MGLETSIPWLDRELEDTRSCYIQCRSKALRHRLLARTVSYNTQKGNTLLLSFTNPRKGFWSFDFKKLLGRCKTLSDMPRLKENLEIQRINTMGRPEDGNWDEILENKYTAVVGDRITHLKSGNLEKYSALDRTAEKLEQLQKENPTLLIDRNPVYRKLADSTDAVIQLEKREGQLAKKIQRSGRYLEKTVKPGKMQRTLTEYAKITK